MQNNNPQIIDLKQEKTDLINDFLNETIKEKENITWISKKIDSFKKNWNKHKYSRLWAWIAISAWAMVAASSGAFAIAWWLIAWRAILGAIGWYIASDAVFDITNKKITKDPLQKLIQKTKETSNKKEFENELNTIYDKISDKSKYEILSLISNAKKNEEKKEKIKKYTSIWVWMVLWAIWWTKAVVAFDSFLTNETTLIVKNKVENILSYSHNLPEIKNVDSKLIKEVFEDIKSDHPKQWYVTLEQSVRRVEWLKQWIELDESSRLKDLNIPVASKIRESSSEIIESMHELWIMKNWENLDDISKNLTEEKIAEILKKTYEWKQFSNTYIQEIPKTILENPVSQIQANSSEESAFKKLITLAWAWLWVIGFWIIHKYKNSDTSTTWKYKKSKVTHISDSSSSVKQKIIQENKKESKKLTSGNKTIIIHSNEKLIKWNENQNKKKRVLIVENYLKKLFWFKLEKNWNQKYDNATIFSKNTIWGKFIITYKDNWIKNDIKINWIDNSIVKSELRTSFNFDCSNFDEKKFSEKIKIESKKLLKKIFIERERIKNMELAKTLTTIEIRKNDLHKIYKQLEDSRVNWTLKETETWWYWFQNIYSFNNWILKLENLSNPKYEEMDLSSWYFWFKDETWPNYVISNSNFATISQFDEYEYDLLWEIFNDWKKSWIKNVISWAINYYNWHKHPGNLFYPSLMDLNDLTAAKWQFISNPFQMTFTWWIVNKLASNINEANKPKNSYILKWSEYWWKNDYIIYFWRINRNKRNHYSLKDLIKINANIT